MDWILKSIEPKSDQLNADDLLTGPIVAKVLDVKRGNDDQPICICIDGGRQPYKPCKSMRRLIIAMWGNDPKAWIGRRMKLFCDPNVMWAGVKVGGIRIEAMSGLERRRSLMLTVKRGHRVEYAVDVLDDVEPNVELRDRIAGLKDYVKTIDQSVTSWNAFADWCGCATVEALAELSVGDVERLESKAREMVDAT